jgi:hypothetical protein
MYTGVGHQKNALGQMCLVAGIYYAWQILLDRERWLAWTRADRLRAWIVIAMLAWLLYMSDSQTSVLALAAAVAVLLVARALGGDPLRALVVIVCVGALLFTLETSLDLKARLLALVGRNPSLTNRTQLWAVLLDMAQDPLLGSGFMGFWSGDRMMIAWQRIGTVVLQAHSGYVEQYLTLGYCGIALIVLRLVQGLVRAATTYQWEPNFALLRLAIVISAGLYNDTEASFYGVNNMWVLLLLGILDVPRTVPAAESPARRVRPLAAPAQRVASTRTTP